MAGVVQTLNNKPMARLGQPSSDDFPQLAGDAPTPYHDPLSPCTRGERAGVRGDGISRENWAVLQSTRTPSPLPLSPEYRGEGNPELAPDAACGVITRASPTPAPPKQTTEPLPEFAPLTPSPGGATVIDLATALRRAGLANPTIGLAEEIVRANLAQQMLARSLLFPTLNAGATLSLHQGDLLTAQGIVRDVQRESLYFGAGANVRGAGTVAIPGVILTAPLADAIFAPRVARQKVVASTFDTQATRNDILLQVANSYLALAGAGARLLALRQSESELADVVRLATNFAATGQGREGDAERARSEALLLRNADFQTQEDTSRAAAELARLLSLDPGEPIRPEPGRRRSSNLWAPIYPWTPWCNKRWPGDPKSRAQCPNSAACDTPPPGTHASLDSDGRGRVQRR